MRQVQERNAFKISGFAMLVVVLALALFSAWEVWRFFASLVGEPSWSALAWSLIAGFLFLLLAPGFFTVQPCLLYTSPSPRD